MANKSATINERCWTMQRSRHFREHPQLESDWLQLEEDLAVCEQKTPVVVSFPKHVVETAEQSFHEIIQRIAETLCKEHKDIAIDPDMLGGLPHVAGLRLSVGDILAKLHHYGDIEQILSVYGDSLTEDHIKQAIAYAQDFLEEVYVHEP